jgi:NAD(P)-dependent dehydrogenase (short-subunit alcohol dehydrogenase family)
MRLKDRVAIVVGAGQSPGEGMGNGRATALTFAREGARVLCVDHHPESAQETVDMIAAKHVIPIMRKQQSGVIINISSMAAITTYPYVAYKATKAAMIAFTEQLAYQNAQYGIRANVILPGLMNTADGGRHPRP